MPALTPNALIITAAMLVASSLSGIAADAVVVRPLQWSDSIQKWKAYRGNQGIEVAEIDASLGSEAIREKIIQIQNDSAGRLRYVLLAGDVSARDTVHVPTFYRESTAMVQFGGDKLIATDNPYGDIDGDDIPDLAVARIPADSAKQLEQALARVIQYETNQDFSKWRRDVHVVAGVGGFGAVADSVIEMTTRRFLADRIPGWSEVSMTQASTSSHYCPDPWRFSEACIDRINDGGMLWVYIGHGHVKTLDYIRAQEQLLPIFNHEHLPAVSSKQPSIAIFLACYTGAFDAIEDSLAEQMLLLEHGPIAAIAATRVSGPYGLSMLSDGLLDQFYQQQAPRLGDAILAAKRRLLSTQKKVGDDRNADSNEAPAKVGGDQMQMISAIASALSPTDYDLRAERLEHVWQMHLLGDPMLQLSHPSEMALRMPDKVAQGETLELQGSAKASGRLTVEFSYRREQVRRELDALGSDLSTDAGRNNFQERYAKANDRILVSSTTDCPAGEFAREIKIPSDLKRGRYCVRAFLECQNSWHVGYQEILVRNP